MYLFFNTAKEVTMATNLQQHGLNGQKKKGNQTEAWNSQVEVTLPNKHSVY